MSETKVLHEWKPNDPDFEGYEFRICETPPDVDDGRIFHVPEYRIGDDDWLYDKGAHYPYIEEILRLLELLEEVDKDGGVIHTPLRARIRQALRAERSEEDA